MTALKKKIEKIITEQGPISISDFMKLALADKKNGYYRKKMPLGSKGDFITSPDISQIFGEIIGVWILDLWIKLGKPKETQIVDLGGGRGTLLSDIKRVLGNKISSYIFIDINVELIKLQKKAVKDAIHFEKIEDIPNKPTIFIGNEFLDTFPINQFVLSHKYFKEVCVNYKNKKLIFSHHRTNLSRALDKKTLSQIKVNDILEINFESRKFIEKLSRFIKENNGGAIFFDYGYTFSHGDTFQAVKDSKFVNPLDDPGNADLTAHVDFNDLYHQAKNSLVSVWGPDTQGTFLKKMGAIERLNALESISDDKTKQKLRNGLDRLINTDEMGELFKVLAITSNKFPSPEGFTCGTRGT
ncbi:SAM-dependent methyltransferase [Rhodobiaceae bacterium]|nr:SAM-dependent methyltransferase [Rhodobiaceae bacterium]